VVDELDVSDHLMDLIHWEFEEQQYLDLKPLNSRDGARNATWWMSIRYRS
jgi:hypothetical protein